VFSFKQTFTTANGNTEHIIRFTLSLGGRDTLIQMQYTGATNIGLIINEQRKLRELLKLFHAIRVEFSFSTFTVLLL